MKTPGRAAFLQLLADEGVTHLFGNPGTTELAIMEVVPDFPQLEFVLGLQEAVVMAMADGFCRASGRLAAANVHVMPGLGNAMGALYNAKFSGSPVILTAGQQEQGHGLLEPMLYEPLVPVAEPLVKWAVEVTRAADLPRIIHRAAKLALTPPTGPVFLSLPGDVLDETIEMDMGKPVRVDGAVRPTDATLNQMATMLAAAKRPAILAGQELASRDAFAEAAQLAETIGAAVFASSIPYCAQFPSEHPAFMGAFTRLQKQVRSTLEGYDLLLVLGADLLRMSVYSPVEPLPPEVPRQPRAAGLLRPRERRPRLRRARGGRHQHGAPRAADRRDRRRRQRDVQHPGPVDRGEREAADHLRDRQQPRLPHHQGA